MWRDVEVLSKTFPILQCQLTASISTCPATTSPSLTPTSPTSPTSRRAGTSATGRTGTTAGPSTTTQTGRSASSPQVSPSPSILHSDFTVKFSPLR